MSSVNWKKVDGNKLLKGWKNWFFNSYWCHPKFLSYNWPKRMLTTGYQEVNNSVARRFFQLAFWLQRLQHHVELASMLAVCEETVIAGTFFFTNVNIMLSTSIIGCLLKILSSELEKVHHTTLHLDQRARLLPATTDRYRSLWYF